MSVRRILTGVVAFASALCVLSATPAQAGDDRVIRTGNCTGSADWKVKAKTDDGRIEFEGEVDSNHNGQVWSWKIKHNGTLSYQGQATTQGPSGSFSIERRMVDLAGTDHFVFRAVHNASGQVCKGTLAF
jgi:osmotically-inducible protein OsmY